jgi:small-conductance mechanosensitive channel
VIYHIIRRWMLIQRRRIAFDRGRSDCALIASRSIIGSSTSTVSVLTADCCSFSSSLV